MKTEILETLEYSKNLIISPDMDGFVSAQLLNRYNGSKVVGTYDKNILCLADDINPTECLFVDCDLNNQNYISIGNHMRLLDDNMSARSFNPNVHYGITKYSDKFPFATAFLIAFATEIETSSTEMIRMAYADSTLRNMESYSDNMRTWSDRMKCPAVDYVIYSNTSTNIVDDEFRTVYPNQSFTSKRYGKDRYIQTLNTALEVEGISYKPLISGVKYMSDKIGLTTMKKYMADIFSYAEIFGGEYSVTYYDRIVW
jgi:hypothetical protein